VSHWFGYHQSHWYCVYTTFSDAQNTATPPLKGSLLGGHTRQAPTTRYCRSFATPSWGPIAVSSPIICANILPYSIPYSRAALLRAARGIAITHYPIPTAHCPLVLIVSIIWLQAAHHQHTSHQIGGQAKATRTRCQEGPDIQGAHVSNSDGS